MLPRNHLRKLLDAQPTLALDARDELYIYTSPVSQSLASQKTATKSLLKRQRE